MTKPALPLNAWMRWDHVERLLPRLDVRTVLEIGAGGGAAAVRLAERYEYLGLEPDPESFERTEARLRALGRGRVLPVDSAQLDPEARFDLVCAFEVLEHLEDDLAALRAWRRHVRDGGFVLLSMPAHQRRFAAHDRAVGHYRRYDPGPTAELLRRAGYSDPLVLTCGFPLGYALEVARNAIGRLHRPAASMEEQTAASGRWLQPPDEIGWLTATIAAPFRLLQRPFAHTGLGTGLVVLAQSSPRNDASETSQSR